MFHYTQSGLPAVWLANGYLRLSLRDGSGVMITRQSGLHRCIARALVKQRNLLAREEFIFLRREMKFTVAALASIMGVCPQVIDNWERGLKPVPRVADVSLRALFIGSILEENEPDLYLHLLSALECCQGAEQLFFSLNERGWQQCFPADAAELPSPGIR